MTDTLPEVDAAAAAIDNRRRTVHVTGSRADLQVPFTEVALEPSATPDGVEENPPIRLYRTAGPDADVRIGLAPVRRAWALERGDVEEYDGRPADARDDGRAAVRSGQSAEVFPAPRLRPLRA